MRVLLDQSVCDVPADTVGQAIDAISHLARQRGRLIVEVLVDGTSWNAQQIDDQAGRASVAREVKLTTADPSELIGQTFQDASLALRDADELQQAAAGQLQAGQTREAMGKLTQAFGIWSSVQQAVEMGTQLAEIPMNSFTVPGEGGQRIALDKVIIQLHARLNQVRSSLQSGDTAALADILLYELPTVVHQWRGVLDELQAAVHHAAKSASATAVRKDR